MQKKENPISLGNNAMDNNLEQYLIPTYFLDYNSGNVANFTDHICAESMPPTERAVALYYAVRDQIKYDPYDLQDSRNALKASSVVKKKSGYCVAKAVLLAAACRRQGIPSRLGFADVSNHLSSKKIREMMDTDLFVYHGYTEIYLNDRWVKATPAFNLELCGRFNVLPLEFDGMLDSIFHEYDALGRKHMEYVREHGHFADLPFEMLFKIYRETYPKFFEYFKERSSLDFEEEAAKESNHTQ